ENEELLNKQYTVLAGKMPEKYNEIVLVVDKNNQISDYTLYSLGLKDPAELEEMMKRIQNGEKVEKPTETSYSFDDVLGLSFRLVVNTDYFVKNEDGTWTDKSEEDLFVRSLLKDAEVLRVVGILKPNEDSTVDNTYGFIGYRESLMETLISRVNESEIVKAQNASANTDIFTGKPFENDFEHMDFSALTAYLSTLDEEEQGQYTAYIAQMQAQGSSEEEIAQTLREVLSSRNNAATYEGNLARMGVADKEIPSAIYLYPKDFDAKETLTALISDYNAAADDADKITYTDYVGLMLSSVTTIINAISYILIAFVSISLVVSSIMIGIITYISVLERTKEIGILRAMGASKRDISRVFNAETLLIGFAAGAIGILVTLVLLFPINAIIAAITEIADLAALPVNGALALVLISMFLTFIAGLIPARIAAQKDPVAALRTE
ncbi:MAG: ABC transporter permease, partial [Clostridia bacterium]|nr:ABC transporter permease [Clostridia bacterium]